MNCKKCGNVLEENSTFCPMCGEKVIKENNNKPAKAKKNNTLYIIIAIVLTILSFAIGFIVGIKYDKKNQKCVSEELTSPKEKVEEKETKDSDYELEEKSFKLFDVSKVTKTLADSSEMSKNIEIFDLYLNPQEKTYSKYKNIYIYGKNNNSKMIHVDITFEFYDKEGYRIDKQYASGEVYGNSEFVLSGYIIDDSKEYASVKLTYKATNSKSYYTEIPSKQIESNITKLNDGTISLRVKNNYEGIENKDAYIFISTACIYYKDGKIVHAVNGTGGNSIHKGETGEIKFYDHNLYINDDYKNRIKIEYDNYKILVYSAYYADSKTY